jgi:predicted AAA+ superfamily ATPase
VSPSHVDALVWHGVEDANPWWETAKLPASRTSPFRRHAFSTIYAELRRAEAGRGLVVLGPPGVGKTVLIHQVVEQLLADGVAPAAICMLALDDVALRGRDLGALLELVDARRPLPAGAPRYLVLDEVQHSPEWSGWLKRIADRRDPYVFLATGSSATALRRGGQDAGLGRWREMTLFPWSFREHVDLRGLFELPAKHADAVSAVSRPTAKRTVLDALVTLLGLLSPAVAERLHQALVDYLLRGGFPEAALAPDLVEARRRLRQDILDRALGRDLADVVGVDSQVLERMFLRVCEAPGGLWNESTVASDLGITRPTVNRYLRLLEQSFLVFQLPNLASPVKGQRKVYLVAPSIRQALYGHDERSLRQPAVWGQLLENVVAATVVGTRPDATRIGFWRTRSEECDLVVTSPREAEYIEVKSTPDGGSTRGIVAAANALGLPGRAIVLGNRAYPSLDVKSAFLRPGRAYVLPAALWLWAQEGRVGGTLRMRVE